MFETKTTTNGRQPQNIKSWISQQPLIWSSSNFKLKLREPNQNHKCLKGRWPAMEEDLKILKVLYISNHWSDYPQILNLSLGYQTKTKYAWNKYDLKTLKVELLSNHWSDLPQILNLSLGNWTKITNAWKEDDQ